MNNLTAADRAMFESLRIPLDLVERAGVGRVTDGQARGEFGIRGGGDMSGIAYPYFDPETMANVRRRNYGRIRRDHPEIEDGKEKKKYVAPYGDRKHLYFPPEPKLFADASVPIVLVEAEKSVLALTAWSERTKMKILALGMGGCWGFRGQVGIKETATGERVPETGPIRDLNICREGRRTYVLLDANCSTNPHVQAARRDLVRQLRKQGADVRVLDLPTGEWNGPDDFLAVQGDQAMLAILEGAEFGVAVLNDVETFLRRFVVMSAAQFTATTLWIVHTYVFLLAIWTPYLAVTSAAKRCGKSRLLELLFYLVSKAWYTSSASAASLFREIDRNRPTLLLDETDALFKANKEMAEAVRMVLNAGAHHKGTVSRVVGQGTKMYTKNFHVFCPKALAGIGNLPDTVADRSLHIRLERKMSDQKVERLREKTIGPEAARLRQRLENWTERQLSGIMDTDPELPEEMNDRAQDAAEILLAIADAAGGEWPTRARKSLIELYTGEAAEDQSFHVRLLTDIRSAFDGAEVDKLSSADLVATLVQMESSPWGEWYRGKPLTAISLARLLKPFRIAPRTIRIGEGTPKGYDREVFTDSWERYLPKNPPATSSPVIPNATPPQANVCAGPEPFSETQQNSAVAPSQNEESLMSTRVVADVAGQKRENDDGELVLPCEIHGRHADWWTKLLPGGGEMTCGKCEAQS